MKLSVRNAIKIYSKKRLHYSNYIVTPNEVHQQSKIKRSTYKAKNSCEINFATV